MSEARNLDQYRSRLQDKERAARYSERFERGSRRRVNAREQAAVRTILAGLDEVDVVLDVPCGAGRFAALLGSDDRRLIGIDVAEEALVHARIRASQAGVSAEFLQGDASNLPLADDTVDCAFSNRLLHHILDRAERLKILRELRRVTRRHAIVSFFNYHSFGGIRRFLKALKGRKTTYKSQPTRDEFIAEVREAGFEVVKIKRTGAPWVAQVYFVLRKA